MSHLASHHASKIERGRVFKSAPIRVRTVIMPSNSGLPDFFVICDSVFGEREVDASEASVRARGRGEDSEFS